MRHPSDVHLDILRENIATAKGMEKAVENAVKEITELKKQNQANIHRIIELDKVNQRIYASTIGNSEGQGVGGFSVRPVKDLRDRQPGEEDAGEWERKIEG